jgi:hypothetical protein
MASGIRPTRRDQDSLLRGVTLPTPPPLSCIFPVLSGLGTPFRSGDATAASCISVTSGRRFHGWYPQMCRHREERSDETIQNRAPALDCFAYGSHMWTAPCLQEVWGWSERIACAHMCGFGALMGAAELVSATRAPSNDAALLAVASLGMSRVPDRSITPSPRASSGLWRTRLPVRQTHKSVSLFDRAPFLRPDHLDWGAPRAGTVKERVAPAQRRRRRP